MNFIQPFYVAASTAFLMLWLAPSSLGQVKAPPLTEYLPKNTAVYVGVTSLSELAAKSEQTDFAKMLKVDGIKQFVEQIRSRTSSGAHRQPSLVDCASMLQEGGGAAALIVVERPKAVPGIALLVDSGDKLPTYRARLDRLKAQLAAKGFSAVAAEALTAYESKSAGSPPSVQCWFESDAWVCLSNDLELAQSIRKRISAGESARAESLASLEVFLGAFQQCADIAAPDVWFYAEPVAVAQLTQKDPDDGVEPRDVMTKHGFHQLEAIAAKMEIAKGNRELEYDFFAKVEKPYVKSMRMIDLAPVANLDPPAWLDDGVNNLVQTQWNAKSLLEHIAGPFDEIIGEEGTLATTLEDLKSDIGPGVDLQKELFDNLEAPVLTFGRHDGVIGPATEHTLVAVTIGKGKEAAVASAVKKLFIDDSNAVREPLGAVDLWRIGGKKPVGAGKAGVRFKSSGIMVASGYLFMSSNVDGLRRLLPRLAKSDKALVDNADYLRAKTEFGAAVNQPSIFRLYYSLARDMENSYELLRLGQVDSAESIYAQMLAPLVAADRKRGSPYDFSKLPPFSAVSPFLGTAFANGVDTESGWKVHGFVLKNAAAPKAAK